MGKNKWIASVLAMASVSLVAGAARADTMYTTQITSTPVPGLGLSITPLSSDIVGDGPANVTIADFSYNPTSSGTGSQTLTVVETLSGDAGSETVTIPGTLSYTYSPVFVASMFTPTGETVTGSGYTVPFAPYMPSTNGESATLTLSIIPTVTAAPLPGAAGCGTMLLGAVGLTQLRRRSLFV